MGAFGFTDYAPAAASELVRNNAKVTDGSPQNTFETLRSLVVSPASYEYVAVTKISAEGAMDTVIAEDLLLGYSMQNEDSAEGSSTQFGTVGVGAAATRCTSDTFTERSTTGTPIHRGLVGKDVTIRVKCRVDTPGDVTNYCVRNCFADGRLVKRYGFTVGNAAFQGAF